MKKVHVLDVRRVTKCFTQAESVVTVLKDVSVTFFQNGTYAIIGVSGTGKSTLLHLCAGLEKPDEGAVFFDEKNIAFLGDKERQEFLGLAFQLPYLIKELSVIENIMLKGLIAGIPYQKCREKAFKLLTEVGLTEKADVSPPTLSGGQKQQVSILRALFNEPSFLLVDEPTASLDGNTGKFVIDFLLDCHKHWDIGIIVNSHDSYVARHMQTVFRLHEGTASHVVEASLESDYNKNNL